MAKNYEETLKNVKANVDACLKEANAALKSKDLNAYEKAKVTLMAAVENYTDAARDAAFDKLRQTEQPLMTAIRQLYVTSYRVKEEKGKEGEDEGTTIGLSIVANEKTRIDFDKFCEFASISKEWLHECANLLALLQLRKVDLYTMKAADLPADSYYAVEAFRKAKAGETPTSNTQIVKVLQHIVDLAIFEDNGKGQNVHKCTRLDLEYIEDCAHQFDPKAKAGIRSMKPRAFKTVMVSVLYAILTGEGYTVTNYSAKK